MNGCSGLDVLKADNVDIGRKAAGREYNRRAIGFAAAKVPLAMPEIAFWILSGAAEANGLCSIESCDSWVS